MYNRVLIEHRLSLPLSEGEFHDSRYLDQFVIFSVMGVCLSLARDEAMCCTPIHDEILDGTPFTTGGMGTLCHRERPMGVSRVRQ